jgi:hypothetical protein
MTGNTVHTKRRMPCNGQSPGGNSLGNGGDCASFVLLLLVLLLLRKTQKLEGNPPPPPPQKRKRKIQAKLPDRDETQGVSTWQWWDMRDEHGIRLMS